MQRILLLYLTFKKHIKPNGFLGFQNHLRTFATAPCTVRLDDERRRLVVEVNSEDKMEVSAEAKMMRQEIGGEVHEYPWVWLRDNCQCPECYEPISHCRIINLTEWELNVRPASVQVRLVILEQCHDLLMQNLDDKIVITWEDGHVSPFDKSWLASRSFRTSSREGYRSVMMSGMHDDDDIISGTEVRGSPRVSGAGS